MNPVVATPVRREVTRARVLWYGIRFLLLSPLFLVAAWLKGGPGLGVHLFCQRQGVKLLARKRCTAHARWIYYPLESTRYIEIDFVKKHAGNFQRWLDVSSPRQIAARLLTRNRTASATLLNPDAADLAETKQMADLLGLKCQTVNATVDGFESGSRFDLITSVSVVEHIPNDAEALRKLWQMLDAGGRLILTVPASAKGGDQLMDQDPYGLQTAVAGGFFFQRFYSQSSLRELEKITGEPVAVEVWGEIEKGWLQANFEQKRRDSLYPVWREPYDMARHWRRFASVDALPGEGVYCAVFLKKNP